MPAPAVTTPTAASATGTPGTLPVTTSRQVPKIVEPMMLVKAFFACLDDEDDEFAEKIGLTIASESLRGLIVLAPQATPASSFSMPLSRRGISVSPFCWSFSGHFNECFKRWPMMRSTPFVDEVLSMATGTGGSGAAAGSADDIGTRSARSDDGDDDEGVDDDGEGVEEHKAMEGEVAPEPDLISMSYDLVPEPPHSGGPRVALLRKADNVRTFVKVLLLWLSRSLRVCLPACLSLSLSLTLTFHSPVVRGCCSCILCSFVDVAVVPVISQDLLESKPTNFFFRVCMSDGITPAIWRSQIREIAAAANAIKSKPTSGRAPFKVPTCALSTPWSCRDVPCLIL